MLTQEDPNAPRQARSARRRRGWVVPVLLAVTLIVLTLRHDFWNWDTPYPLLFGFLPAGLWWQAMVSILACIMMWLFVTLAWPEYLEDEIEHTKNRKDP